MQPSPGPLDPTSKEPFNPDSLKTPPIGKSLKGLNLHERVPPVGKKTAALGGRVQHPPLHGSSISKKIPVDQGLPPPLSSPPPPPPPPRGLGLKLPRTPKELPVNFSAFSPSPLKAPYQKSLARIPSSSPEFPLSSQSPSPKKSSGIDDSSPASIIAGAKTPESTDMTADVITAVNNVIEALGLPDSLRQVVEESITFVKLHKETWKELGQDATLILETGVRIDYNVNFNSVTLTIEGYEVDFDSLILPKNSPLADRKFHEDHLFIIKNQVRYVNEARQREAERKEQRKLALPIQVIYINTKENIGTEDSPRYLQRALMFTSDNQVLMHLNKKPIPKIGVGGFKKVSLAINIKTGEEFGSASIPLTGLSHRYAARQELLWGTHPVVQSHPDCLQLNSFIAYDSRKLSKSGEPIQKVRILYPRLQGEELFTILKDKRKLTKEERIFIIKKLAEITHHFHKNGVALKDLKTENFFIGRDEEGNIKVTAFDFGLLQNFEEETTQGGTLDYKAPEYRELDSKFTSSRTPPLSNEEKNEKIKLIDKAKGDVWALGMMLCEVIGEPWASIRYLHPILKATNDLKADITGLPATLPLDATPLESLVWKMLQINPTDRPSMDEVVKALESI